MSKLSSAPLVSIGVPVYNGAETLEPALRSLQRQTHSALEIVISDNASTDATQELAQRLASDDARIRYHRQEENVGAAANFRYVLEESSGPFFMWAAADDSWEPTFVEQNLKALLDDRGLAGSVSKVAWQVDGHVRGLAPGTAALDGTVSQNIKNYLRTARDNSRFYGLFRRDTLLRSYPPDDFLGLDLAVMVGTLRFGRHGEVDEILMTRHRNDPSDYAQHPDAPGVHGLARLFPLLPLTRYLVRGLRVPLSPGSVILLLVRNIYEHLRSAGLRQSAYGTVARQLLRLGEPFRRRTVSG